MKTIAIDPLAEVELGHGAVHLDAAADSGHIVAMASTGEGTLLTGELRPIASFRRAEPTDVSISPDGTLIAVADGRPLTIVSTSSFKTVHILEGFHESCLFTSVGALWSCSRHDAMRIEVRSPGTWGLEARDEVKDPFGDSSWFKLIRHPDPTWAAVWVAAGQDGQNLFWAHREKESMVVERFADLGYCTPPAFASSGEEFLVIAGDELRRYRFPDGPLLSRMIWPFDGDDSMVGDYVAYIDGERALLSSCEGPQYVVDLVAMEIEAEVVIRTNGAPGWFLRLPCGDFLSVRHDGQTPRLATWRFPLER